jgi:uncharacterized protein (TIGR04255 family)
VTAPLTFAKAPVTQAIISVPIERLSDLRAAHVGAFWATIDRELPDVDEYVASPAPIERFGEPDPIDLDVDFAYDEVVEVPRMVLSGPDSPWYLAIQNDQLELSWIKREGADYPRFPALLRTFEERFAQWTQFVEGKGVGKVQPIQAGFTYNNRLRQGDTWETADDLRDLFKLPPGRDVDGELNVFHFADHTAVRDDEGTPRRVHLSFMANFEQEVPTATLNIRCRGPLADNDRPLSESITAAHDYALRAFVNFTTQKAQALWELQS